MELIDEILNRVTMYRLTLYYLCALIGIAFIYCYFGILPYSAADLIISTGTAIFVSYLANWVFAKIFKAVTNVESVFITALILVLIVPFKFPVNFVFIVAVCVFAMASKYFTTIEKMHIFNPAAAAVVAVALLSPERAATWWVGTPAMFLPVLIGGLLLTRKIRRETLVVNFLIAYVILVSASTYLRIGTLDSIFLGLRNGLFQSSLLFFMFVMLTEPLTSPVTEKLQAYYSYLVAILYATPQLRLFGIIFTPEMALVLGNIFSYFISPKYRLELALVQKEQVSPDTLTFSFKNQGKMKFTPGQYMEWTLPHRGADSRGVRRYFSIASSPTEEDLLLAVKFYSPSSTYKQALFNLENENQIIASSLAGDFVLPNDISKPLVFISGGVGIAPFRSMIKYILDKNLTCDIVHIFINRNPEDIIFKDVLDSAIGNGVKTIYALTNTEKIPAGWTGLTGHLTSESVKQAVPDYDKRIFYVSGPQLMVQSVEKTLLSTGIGKRNIKTDFFPGYVEK